MRSRRMRNLPMSIVIPVVAAVLLAAAVPAATAADSVGVVMTGDIPYYRQIHKSFAGALGGGAKLVVQTPAPEPMAWANSARKLVTIGSAVIVSYGAPATLSAMKATSSVPIVFAGVYDPQAMRIMGKNATGASSTVPLERVVEALKAVTNVQKIGVVFNKTEKDTILQVKELKGMEGRLGFKMVLMDATKEGYDVKLKDVDALLLTTSCRAMCNVDDIVDAARKARIPTAATVGGAEARGIIFTLAADPAEQGRILAEIVREVLGGRDPAALPVREPRQIQFIVNQQAAGAIGLQVPGSLLSQATRVIE